MKKPYLVKNGESPVDLKTKTNVCGANNYFKDSREVHFVITGDPTCIVRLTMKNTVKVTAHFEIDIDDFFNGNRYVNFVSGMAAFLNLDPA